MVNKKENLKFQKLCVFVNQEIDFSSLSSPGIFGVQCEINKKIFQKKCRNNNIE